MTTQKITRYPAAKHMKNRPSLGVRKRIDVTDYYRTNFVLYAASCVKPGERVLDAAAGDCPDEPLFQGAIYESCDWQQNKLGRHAFVCDIQDIPAPAAKYDAVLCLLALDDLPHPEKCFQEFHRILRPGGQLFISGPLNGRVHNHPYHFFHYSQFGLKLLCESAGLEIIQNTPWGGIFSCLSHFSYKLPKYIKSQEPLKRLPWGLRSLARLLLYPFYGLGVLLFSWIIPLLCFYLDRLDRVRDFTLGYGCHARKPLSGMAKGNDA